MKIKYVSLWLCLFLILIFIFQSIFPVITENFILVSSKVSEKPWTLLTSVFLHSNFLHLLYNIFALALFGAILENIIGTRKFIILFFISGILASLSSIFIYNVVLGASGAIFGVIGCLIILRPKKNVLVYGMPMPLFIAGIIYAVIDIFGLFAPSNTANLAHLSGLVFGLVYGFFLRKNYAIRTIKKEKSNIDEDLVQRWEDDYLKQH